MGFKFCIGMYGKVDPWVLGPVKQPLSLNEYLLALFMIVHSEGK